MFAKIIKNISIKKIVLQLIVGTIIGLLILTLSLSTSDWFDWNPFFIYHTSTPLLVIGCIAVFSAAILLWLKFRHTPIQKFKDILGLFCGIILFSLCFYWGISSVLRAISYHTANKPAVITARVEYSKVWSKNSKVVLKTSDNKTLSIKWNDVRLGWTQSDRFYNDMQGLKPLQDLSEGDNIRLEGRTGCFGFAIDRVIID